LARATVRLRQLRNHGRRLARLPRRADRTQQTLDDAWTAVRDLPLLAEALVWLLGFPFLVGLAIWHASWDEAVRLVAIALLALAYTWMFTPREWLRRDRGPGR
jgi:hypothetical protein